MLILRIMYLTFSRMRNCSQDFEKTAHQQTVGLEHSASTPRTVLNPSAVIEV